MGNEKRVIARNKKARHDYTIDETYEAGLKLQGTEIKSIRAGKVNLKDSFALVEDGEVFLYNMHISPYSHGNRANHEPERKRKLLLNKSEIRTFFGKTTQKGYTLIPLSLYIIRNVAKIQLALAQGKNVRDKRRDIAKKTADREIEKAFRDRQKY